MSTQQAPKDTDGCLKKIHIHILVEGKLLLHPVPRLCKLCTEKEWDLMILFSHCGVKDVKHYQVVG